ncbi:MAG: metalloregulator ArsR/SmtB family transcription factor [Coriobacteriales bacterium]|nr:metalloregulator ArsR/SmtB family transcription factor [Coriobacteriales bacterium]
MENATLIKSQFHACRRLLVALGDETRQLIIAVLAETECEGMRVGDIAEQTHLSRPAVSHHLKILLDAEVVGLTKQATKHFYYLALGGEWQSLVELLHNIQRLKERCLCPHEGADRAVRP